MKSFDSKEHIFNYLEEVEFSNQEVSLDELSKLISFCFSEGYVDEAVFAKIVLHSRKFLTDFTSEQSILSLNEIFSFEPQCISTFPKVLILKLKGSLCQSTGEQQAAIEHYLKALQYLSTYTDERKIVLKEKGSLYLNLGMIFVNSIDYVKSEYYALKALDIFKNIDYKKGIAISQMILGEIYRKQMKFELAVQNLIFAVTFLETTVDFIRIVVCYNMIGDLYYSLNNLDDAKKYLQKALNLAQQHNIKITMRSTFQQLSDVAIHEKDYGSAIEYLKKSVEYDTVSGSRDTENANRFKTLANLYSNLEDYKLAFENLQEFIKINDKVREQAHTKEVYELEIRYQIQQKEMEADILKKSKEKIELTNKRLQESNKELEDYAHIISHDLREPVRMVTSYLNLIEKSVRDKLTGQEQEYMNFTIEGAQRINSLISDLLEFSKIGRKNEMMVPINLNEVIIIVQAFLKQLFEQRNVKFSTDQLPEVVGVKSQWVQLFMNLIENGIKYNKNEIPEVRLIYKNTEENHVIIFRDNGIGISKEYYQKVFVMFQRLHSRKEYSGTGIGLAICKKIVERHGGVLSIDSEPGKGSDFIITIPKINAVKAPSNSHQFF